MNTTIEGERAEKETTVMAGVASGPTEAMPKEWQQHHDH